MTVQDDAETKVRDTVIDAYYADRVRVGTAARSRAQAAQSIVTIFAGTLVAAFTFTALRDRAPYTQVSGCATVGLWLAAAILYVRAVATPVPPPIGTDRVRSNSSDVISALLRQADHERSRIDRRQMHANLLSIAALAMTVITFTLMLFGGKAAGTARGSIALTAAGVHSVAKLCGNAVDRLDGAIVLSTINSAFIAITIKKCGSHRNVRIQLPRDGVASLYVEEE